MSMIKKLVAFAIVASATIVACEEPVAVEAAEIKVADRFPGMGHHHGHHGCESSSSSTSCPSSSSTSCPSSSSSSCPSSSSSSCPSSSSTSCPSSSSTSCPSSSSSSCSSSSSSTDCCRHHRHHRHHPILLKDAAPEAQVEADGEDKRRRRSHDSSSSSSSSDSTSWSSDVQNPMIISCNGNKTRYVFAYGPYDRSRNAAKCACEKIPGGRLANINTVAEFQCLSQQITEPAWIASWQGNDYENADGEDTCIVLYPGGAISTSVTGCSRAAFLCEIPHRRHHHRRHSHSHSHHHQN